LHFLYYCTTITLKLYKPWKELNPGTEQDAIPGEEE
jgi:hypothetical protein